MILKLNYWSVGLRTTQSTGAVYWLSYTNIIIHVNEMQKEEREKQARSYVYKNKAKHATLTSFFKHEPASQTETWRLRLSAR